MGSSAVPAPCVAWVRKFPWAARPIHGGPGRRLLLPTNGHAFLAGACTLHVSILPYESQSILFLSKCLHQSTERNRSRSQSHALYLQLRGRLKLYQILFFIFFSFFLNLIFFVFLAHLFVPTLVLCLPKPTPISIACTTTTTTFKHLLWLLRPIIFLSSLRNF